MPGNIINNQWKQCAFREHLLLHEVIIRELDLFPTLEAFSRVDGADLQEVLEMIVARPHSPCVYGRNGVLPEFITTVEHALNLCQMKNNSSMQKLAEVIQYFHDIDRSDILELQIIYSL